MGNMSGLTEGIIVSLIFVVLFTAVIANLNTTYDEDYNVGLSTDALDDFNSYAGNAHEQTGGEVESTNQGLTLVSSWKMAKGLYSTLWSFFNGSWINTIIIDMLKIGGSAGYILALTLRTLFLLTLLFAIIKLFFKIKP